MTKTIKSPFEEMKEKWKPILDAPLPSLNDKPRKVYPIVLPPPVYDEDPPEPSTQGSESFGGDDYGFG